MTDAPKPRRSRRTKAEMQAARAAEAEAVEIAAQTAVLKARLALATPAQIKQAERTLWHWNHPRY